MTRVFTTSAAVLAIVLIAATSNAQYPTYPVSDGQGFISPCPSQRALVDHHGSYRPDLHSDHFVAHRPDVDKLDQYADQLAAAAKHLHEDAHQLGQDYEHSQSIEAYVQRLDRLNEHMHEILHRAAERRHLSNYEIRHVAMDVLNVRGLATRLDAELEHQRIDGARTQDFVSLDHMRQILAGEVFQLVRRMEYELDYRSTAHHASTASHAPAHSYRTHTASRSGN